MRPREFDTHPVSFAQAMTEGLWRGVGKGAHDGDTFIAFVDKGMFDYAMVTLRLTLTSGQGINAPEIVGTEGLVLQRAQQAKALIDVLTLDKPILFRTQLAKTGAERMSFDRYIAGVYYFEPNYPGTLFGRRDLGQALVDARLADLI